jgi:hypothetical protein
MVLIFVQQWAFTPFNALERLMLEIKVLTDLERYER